jgi:hypothetical protein
VVRHIVVSMMPGFIALTVIPCGASAFAADCVRLITANLLAL